MTRNMRNYYKIGQDACGVGMVAYTDGRADHQLVLKALHIAEKLDHRVGKDTIGKVGDGMGILLQISHCFFRKVADQAGIFIKNSGDYGIGMFFFPQEKKKRAIAMRRFELLTEKLGMRFLGWRQVPVDPQVLAQAAQESMPYICQGFISRPKECGKGNDFEAKLYALRCGYEKIATDTCVCSLSSRLIVYKGMFLKNQLTDFYPDLQNKYYKSALALVQTCFYTGTNASWDKALMACRGADSAILFSDGDVAGFICNPKELRACRYYITDNHCLILATEVGLLPVKPEHIIKKSYLPAGKVLLVDTREKKISLHQLTERNAGRQAEQDRISSDKEKKQVVWNQIMQERKHSAITLEEVEPVSEIIRRLQGTKDEILLDFSFSSDLAQSIYDLKNANRKSNINVRLHSEEAVGNFAVAAARAGARVIRISGDREASGQRIHAFRNHAGWSWEYGICAAHQALISHGLREKVMLETDAEMTSGRDLADAILLGAERFSFAREFSMVSVNRIAGELREIMADMGFHTVNEMAVHHFCPSEAYDFQLERTLDAFRLLPDFFDALHSGEKYQTSIEVNADHRSVGTMLGAEIREIYEQGLQEDTYIVNCKGSTGRSFGAFIPNGLTLRLQGDANDGLGKGLAGGKLVVQPPAGIRYRAEDNLIAGNEVLCGARQGKAYICGMAGDYFCLGNDGAIVVAEGCGDHGLESMTGGKVVILGSAGKHFAAGMTGGTAYVLDRKQEMDSKLDRKMLSLQSVSTEEEITELKAILLDYLKETGSSQAAAILDDFGQYLPYFRKVMAADHSDGRKVISPFLEQPLVENTEGLAAYDRMNIGA